MRWMKIEEYVGSRVRLPFIYPRVLLKMGREGGREEEDENVVIITDSYPGTQELLSVREPEGVRSSNRLFLHPQRS